MRLPRILDDAAKLGTAALMVVANVRHELRGAVQTRLDGAADRLGVARRSEVDAALDLARKARQIQEELAQRLTRLEQGSSKN